MANVQIKTQNFKTAALCSDNCCCVAIRQDEEFFYIADTKNKDQKPLVFKTSDAEVFKKAVKNGEFDLDVLTYDSQYGIAVRRDGFSVLVSNPQFPYYGFMRFTLKEWSAFIHGVKEGEFDSEVIF